MSSDSGGNLKAIYEAFNSLVSDRLKWREKKCE